MQHIRRMTWLTLALAVTLGVMISLSACAPGGAGVASQSTGLGTPAPSTPSTPSPRSTPTAPPLQGTVDGVVLASPGCPVDQVPNACPPRPVPNREVFFTPLKGGKVAQETTDQQGKFTAVLPPGTYMVKVPQTGSYPIQRQPQQVTVVAGQTVQLQIILDSGIR